MKVTTLTLVLLCFSASVGTAQEPLKEIARRNGGKADALVTFDGPRRSLEDAIERSSLIVLGRITEMIPHLSEDEALVYNEYMVDSLEILNQPAELSVGAKAGPIPPIRFIQVGGVLRTEGLILSTTSNWFAPITVGDVYWLLLSRATPSRMTTTRFEAGVYGPAYCDLSIFRVDEGRLKSDSDEFGQSLRRYLSSAR